MNCRYLIGERLCTLTRRCTKTRKVAQKPVAAFYRFLLLACLLIFAVYKSVHPWRIVSAPFKRIISANRGIASLNADLKIPLTISSPITIPNFINFSLANNIRPSGHHSAWAFGGNDNSVKSSGSVVITPTKRGFSLFSCGASKGFVGFCHSLCSKVSSGCAKFSLPLSLSGHIQAISGSFQRFTSKVSLPKTNSGQDYIAQQQQAVLVFIFRLGKLLDGIFQVARYAAGKAGKGGGCLSIFIGALICFRSSDLFEAALIESDQKRRWNLYCVAVPLLLIAFGFTVVGIGGIIGFEAP